MSKNEWEEGEIVLPTAEYAFVRKAVQDADDRHKRAVFDETQRFWKGLTRKEQTDAAAYRSAVNRYVDALASRHWPSMGDHLADDVHDRLEGPLRVLGPDRRWTDAQRPRRVLASDMDYPTNRTTTFTARGASVAFNHDRKSVTWYVGENNHAVDTARESQLGQALFEALGSVKWTGSTGGVISGNDEYHQEDTSYGGGGNYCTDAFGPLGAAEAPGRGDPYQDASGKWWKPCAHYGRGFTVGKIVEVKRGRRSMYGPLEWLEMGKPQSPPVGAAPRGSRTRSGTARAKTTAASNSGSFAPTRRGEAHINWR